MGRALHVTYSGAPALGPALGPSPARLSPLSATCCPHSRALGPVAVASGALLAPALCAGRLGSSAPRPPAPPSSPLLSPPNILVSQAHARNIPYGNWRERLSHPLRTYGISEEEWSCG